VWKKSAPLNQKGAVLVHDEKNVEKVGGVGGQHAVGEEVKTGGVPFCGGGGLGYIKGSVNSRGGDL